MMASPDPGDLAACEVLWRFNSIEVAIADPDVLLVMGSNDLNVAAHAAQLAHDIPHAVIICSGGLVRRDDLLKTGWGEPEAVVFSNALLARGVAPDRILVERWAQNTADNVRLSRTVLQAAGIEVEKLLVVQKPFMCLRALLTARHQWHGIDIGVSHENIAFQRYFLRYGDTSLIDVIVGDTQRVISYPGRGFFAAVPVPEEVRTALDRLVARGYTRHMPA
jgi:uncharacterized SAM-binding protein YcdF (DUF218 family)